MNHFIEQLAREKDFAALSAAEQQCVLAEMTRAEFGQLHALLRTARQLDAEAVPPARLRARLVAEMGSARKPGIWSAKVRVWKAAAVLLLSITAIWLFKKETLRETVVTETTVRVDTVWQEKIVWRERVVWKNKVVFREKSPQLPIAVLPQPPMPMPGENDFLSPDLSTERVGTSLGDTPELMGFFTQGDR